MREHKGHGRLRHHKGKGHLKKHRTRHAHGAHHHRKH